MLTNTVDTRQRSLMLYYNTGSGRAGDTPVKAHAGMKWFRSNIRLFSQLAVFALAIQFPLSFGHFHGSATASRFHNMVGSNGASQPEVSVPVRSKTSSDHEHGGQPTEGCAICAVMALGNALVVATPPYLLGRQAAAFLYLITDAEFIDPNSAGVAFQPRAPPVS
jgi:hypothetical protein